MIRIKNFNPFSINMGPFSGRGCPDVHYRPTVADWVLDGVALLLVLLGWVAVLVLYREQGGRVSGEVWAAAVSSVLVFALLAAGARMPVRFINFPVRVGAHNIGRQYMLAVRLMRALNICLCLLFASGPLSEHYAWSKVLMLVSLGLLVLSLAVYYVLAFRYK